MINLSPVLFRIITQLSVIFMVTYYIIQNTVWCTSLWKCGRCYNSNQLNSVKLHPLRETINHLRKGEKRKEEMRVKDRCKLSLAPIQRIFYYSASIQDKPLCYCMTPSSGIPLLLCTWVRIWETMEQVL